MSESAKQVWAGHDEEGRQDMIFLEERSDKWYGCGNKFDFSRPTEKEAQDQLKAWGYQFIGWE